MKIKLTRVSIEDYDKALKFYTEALGFVKKRDIPLGGGARWITVVSPEDPMARSYCLSQTPITPP